MNISDPYESDSHRAYCELHLNPQSWSRSNVKWEHLSSTEADVRYRYTLQELASAHDSSVFRAALSQRGTDEYYITGWWIWWSSRMMK